MKHAQEKGKNERWKRTTRIRAFALYCSLLTAMKGMNLQLHVKVSHKDANSVFLLPFARRQRTDIELPYRNVTHFYRIKCHSLSTESHELMKDL